MRAATTRPANADARRSGSARVLPVSAPALVGNELAYVTECLRSGWISGAGHFVAAFEEQFALACGVRHAVAVCNGSAALHLALLVAGVQPGDEVIVPCLTYVATANAVSYCGATPVFVDSEPGSWNLDPAAVAAAITPRTVGVIAVHLYGHPAQIDVLKAITGARGLFLIEDAAQAHGARYNGRPVGSLAHAATFSLYGNKLLTSGEGGILLTDNAQWADTARSLRNHGQDPHRRYHFTRLGFNYRMANTAAAIGLAQLEKIDWHVEHRLRNGRRYRERLAESPAICFQTAAAAARPVYWLTSLSVTGASAISRDELMAHLDREGIETRPVFPPLHRQPVYLHERTPTLPVAERLAATGVSLPSGAGLTSADVDRVADAILTATS
jgi:perosamine synthetase